VDLSQLPDTTGQPFERAVEILVESRRGLLPEAVLDDYEQVSSTGLERLAGMAALDVPVPLSDAGTYPAAALPAAYAFDHYTHIRADLFAPRGPLLGPVPPSDELRLVPVLDWIEAALPQQNLALLASAGAADIVITGTAARTFRAGDPEGPPSAVVRSDAGTCVRWITQRASWEDLEVQAEGDLRTLAALQRVKVF
jgi:hypothetical protein